ncbi:MAG: hypothetical protein BWY47_01050 [Bacteroidetes bacterium ADurb.Bin302]|nr:MAG: hypothetical protein BWY47_01050 [Bacteroidetes bacterium ADurb.Bin302]
MYDSEDTYLYLDPPYANTSGMYYGSIDYEQFWEWIRIQKGFYILSFDGKTTKQDNTYAVPKDLYTKHIYTSKAISGFRKLHQQTEYVSESLYIK